MSDQPDWTGFPGRDGPVDEHCEHLLARLEAIENSIGELSGQVLALRDAISTVYHFTEEMRPFLELAKTYTGGSKADKLRAVIRSGR